MTDNVPSVSLLKLDSSKEEQTRLYHSLTEVGFVYITDHGVPKEIVQKVHKLTEDQLFNVSCKERQKLCELKNSLLNYGDIYNNKDKKTVNFQSDKSLDLREIDSAFHTYIEEMKKVNNTVIELVTGANIGKITGQFFIGKNSVSCYPVLIQHANYYKAVPKNRWAFVEHVDSSIMTMLMQNGIDGLEIDFNGKWIKVPFRENTFVVNLATWHRVRIKKNIQRFSWPTFFTLSPDATLVQVKEFSWNSDAYRVRLKEERDRILGDNQHHKEPITANTDLVKWLKEHSKRLEAESDFPKLNTQMLEMVESEQCNKLGFDLAENPKTRYTKFE